MKVAVNLIKVALFALSGAAAADTLVLYTSQPATDAQMTVDAFQKANPDTKVEWVRDGTTKLMTKLRAEMSAGVSKPDVLLIADSVTLEQLKKEDKLLAYKAPESAQYDPALFDKEGYYHGTKLITSGIAYNTRAKQKPESWKDLVKPEYKNQISMPSPLYSGAAMIHLSALTRNPDFGWKYYEDLKANGVASQKGNGGVLTDITSGGKPYGILVDYMAIRAKAKGAPIDFVFPAEGVSLVTEPVAILKSAKNPDAAKKFVDFLLSQQGQALVLQQGYIPARNGMKNPPGFPERDQIRLLPFDAAAALQNAEADKEKFSTIYGG
ncbi:ABC transporter substrate-binding protein [Advenella sp. S44]|uniref:ABC transporter substrate-binding protein n=1 Tax=Advenella sp. S44 TaxID=1982755 RepID=UPI000C2B11F0|nr:ABC transporter substrate-binding protein [Advenella sp. S44]PJX26909.1 ABC transporter substrate-binding protein [Advenella sp. S44]